MANLTNDLASLRIEREVNPEAATTRRNRVLIAVLAVVGLIAAFFAYQALSARVFQTEVAITEIRLVSPAQASVLVTSSGFVTAQTSSKVGAKLLGRVAEVLVKEGDEVKAGDVLVRLDDAEAQMAIVASRARSVASWARLQSADANLNEAKRQFERESGLAAQGAALRSTVEDLGSRMTALEETRKAAAADAAATNAEFRQLELNLQYMTVVAPIDGIVLTKPVDVGELVGPTTPTPVAELADFSTLVVETDVPETRLGLIEIGGPAEIVLDAYPSVRHRGRVTEVSPKVNRAKATVVVRVAFVDGVTGEAQVLPDMAARVSFLQGALDADAVKEPPKLFVPASAIVDRGGNKVVYRVVDGKAREERVTLGAPFGAGFELVEGPGDGTRVIADPPPQIADGYPIREKSE